MRCSVNVKNLSVSKRMAALPAMREQLSRYCRFHEHGQDGLAVVQCLGKLYEHPFRNVEIGLARYGVESIEILKVGFLRHIRPA